MTDEFEDAMRPLRETYVLRLKERMAIMRALQQQLQQAPLADHEAEMLRDQAHQLAGNGLTFGFPDISRAGSALDQMMRAKAPPTEWLPALAALLAACERAIATPL